MVAMKIFRAYPSIYLHENKAEYLPRLLFRSYGDSLGYGNIFPPYITKKLGYVDHGPDPNLPYPWCLVRSCQ